MASGRAAKKNNDEFAMRTVMAMATEMAEDRARRSRLYVQFETLALSFGIKVNWDDHTV